MRTKRIMPNKAGQTPRGKQKPPIGQLMQEYLQKLDDPEEFVRQEAVKALGNIGDKRAVGPLIQKLKDTWYVRKAAAEALGEIGDERAVMPLIQLLKDTIEFVREGAAGALGKIRDERAVLPLIRVLKDPNRFVRQVAYNALLDLAERYPKEIIDRSIRYINGNEGLKLTVRCEPNDDAANALHRILLKCEEVMQRAA